LNEARSRRFTRLNQTTGLSAKIEAFEMRVLILVLQAVMVLWLIRVFWRRVAGWLGVSGDSSQAQGPGPRRDDPAGSASHLPPRELVKDPQCGTYVSPEVSVRTRFRGQELHFCSRECEQQFLQAQSKQSA
jgi:YHS domain-containing protein